MSHLQPIFTPQEKSCSLHWESQGLHVQHSSTHIRVPSPGLLPCLSGFSLNKWSEVEFLILAEMPTLFQGVPISFFLGIPVINSGQAQLSGFYFVEHRTSFLLKSYSPFQASSRPLLFWNLGMLAAGVGFAHFPCQPCSYGLNKAWHQRYGEGLARYTFHCEHAFSWLSSRSLSSGHRRSRPWHIWVVAATESGMDGKEGLLTLSWAVCNGKGSFSPRRPSPVSLRSEKATSFFALFGISEPTLVSFPPCWSRRP